MKSQQLEVVAQLTPAVGEQALHLQRADGVADAVTGRPAQVNLGVDAGDVPVEVRHPFQPVVDDLGHVHAAHLQPHIRRHAGGPENPEDLDQLAHAGLVLEQACLQHRLLQVGGPAFHPCGAVNLAADWMILPRGHDAVEAVPRDDRVQMVRRRVAELDLLPEIASAGAHDPGCIGVQHTDVFRDGNNGLIAQESADAPVGGVDTLLVLCGAGGRRQFRQRPVAMPLQRIIGPQAVQFPAPQLHEFSRGPGHQFDLLEVPVESGLADAGAGGPLRAPGNQPALEGGDRIPGGADVAEQLRLLRGSRGQVVVPAQDAGRRHRPVGVTMPYAVCVAEVVNGQVGIIRRNVVQILLRLGDQHRHRPKPGEETGFALPLDRQLGEGDAQHAIDVETRIARPGPTAPQDEVVLVQARAHGQVVDLPGAVPGGNVHSVDAGLKPAHLLALQGDALRTVIGHRINRLSGPVADDLTRPVAGRIAEGQELVQQLHEIRVAAIAGRGCAGQHGVRQDQAQQQHDQPQTAAAPMYGWHEASTSNTRRYFTA